MLKMHTIASVHVVRTYLLVLLLAFAGVASGAVTTTTSRNDYVGTASTATYPYTFLVYANTDLAVIKTLISSGAETTLTLTTDYTVSGVGVASGGSIVLTAGNLPATYRLTIKRAQPLTQLAVLRNQGAFRAEDVEKIVDKATMQTQTIKDSIDRALRLPSSETPTAANTVLPAAATRAGLYLGFDGSGNLAALPGGSGGGGGTGHFIDVEDYNAVADSVTDTTGQLQNAIDALPAYGGILVIRAGVGDYMISAGLDFTGHNHPTIWSNGAKIKFIAATVDTAYGSFPTYGKDSIFRFYQNTDVAIQGPLTLDGNIQNRTAHAVTESFNSCILLSGVVGATIRDVTCNNGMTDGITAVRDAGNVLCKNIILENCHCDSNRRNGLSLVDQNHVTVDSCSFTGTGSNQGVAPKAGIDIEPDRAAGCSLDITIRKCFLDGNLGSYALSVGGKGTTGYTIDNNIIHVSLTGGSAINANATGGFTSTNGRIQNNLLDLSTTTIPTYGGSGMRIVAKNADRITGNRILTFITGIGWFDCDGGIVDHNYFKGNGYGVAFGDVSDPCIRSYCLHNTFEDNTNANSGATWFAMDAYPASATAEIEFSDNEVRNTTGNVDKADGAKMTGAYRTTCIAIGHDNHGFNLLNSYAVVSGDFRCTDSVSSGGTAAVPYLNISGQSVNYEVNPLFIGDRAIWYGTSAPVAIPPWGGIWHAGEIVINQSAGGGGPAFWRCRTSGTLNFDAVWDIVGTTAIEGGIPLYKDGFLQWVGDRGAYSTAVAMNATASSDSTRAIVFADTTAGGFTITLPTSSTAHARIIEYKNVGTANNLTLAKNSTDTLFSTSGSLTSFTVPFGGSVRMFDDDGNGRWVALGGQQTGCVQSNVSTYTNFTTTATIQNLTSVVLTDGEWLETATVTYYGNAATVAALAEATIYLDDTSASATGAVEGETIGYLVEQITSSLHKTVTITYHETLTTGKTKYLNGQATFTGGNPQFVCSLKAVRLR